MWAYLKEKLRSWFCFFFLFYVRVLLLTMGYRLVDVVGLLFEWVIWWDVGCLFSYSFLFFFFWFLFSPWPMVMFTYGNTWPRVFDSYLFYGSKVFGLWWSSETKIRSHKNWDVFVKQCIRVVNRNKYNVCTIGLLICTFS